LKSASVNLENCEKKNLTKKNTFFIHSSLPVQPKTLGEGSAKPIIFAMSHSLAQNGLIKRNEVNANKLDTGQTSSDYNFSLIRKIEVMEINLAFYLKLIVSVKSSLFEDRAYS